MATGSQAMTSFYAKRIIGDSANSLVPNDGLLQVNISNTKLVTRSHNNNSAYYIAYVDDTNAGIDIIEFQNINLELTNTAGDTLTFSTSTIESSGELSVNTTSTSAVVFGGNIHTDGVLTIGDLEGLNLILDDHSIFAREWDSTNEEYIDSALSLGGDTSIDGYLNVVGDFYSGGDIYLAEAKSIFMNYTVPGEVGEEGTSTDFPILVNNDDGTVSLNSLTGALLLGYRNTEVIHISTSDGLSENDWLIINEYGPYATTNLGIGGQDTQGNYILYVNGNGYLAESLTLGGTTASTALINFSREGINYIDVPVDGYLGFTIGGAQGSNIQAMIGSGMLNCYSNKRSALGASDIRWSALYSGSGDFDEDVYISGILGCDFKAATNGRHYSNLAMYDTTTATVTGTFKITLPNTTSNCVMMVCRIIIYEYNSDSGTEILVSGYTYNNSTWYNYNATTVGSYKKEIRLAYDGTNYCILLGTTSTAWNYPRVVLADVYSGYNVQPASPYSVTLITDETGYTISATIYPTMALNRLHIYGPTTGTMTADSTNPRITFSEGVSTQPVHLIYSDWDSYRAPAGLKIIGGTSASRAWLEVEGSIYSGGTVHIRPNTGSYTEGVRIYPTGSWATIMLGGNDMTAETGTTANSWGLFNNNGNFYITRNGSSSSTSALFGCVSNVWHLYTSADIPQGAANLGTLAIANTMLLYRNGILIPNPGTKNDGGILRVKGSSESDTILELGTWDDSGSGETIQFNYYPTTSQVTPTYSITVPKETGTAYLRVPWWTTGNGNNADSLRHGCTFAYSNHNCPTNGTLVAFDCSTNENYTLQLQGQYNGDALYFRNRNGDAGTWRAWQRVVHNSGSWSISVTGSSGSCTGNAATATTASKLGTNAGNANTPVYFSGGVPVATNNKLGAINANGYWGMRGADNGDSWIRTTSSGIIPVQSGSAGSGHCGLGTSTWYFSYVYADNFYGKLNGNCTGSSGSCTGNANTANYQNCVATNEIRYARNGNMASANDLWQGWAFAEGKVAVINGWRFGNGNGGLAPIYGSKVYNAVWNDFAEYRESDEIEGGRVLVSNGSGKLVRATERLQPAARVISDTFGCSVGMSDIAKTPIGVAGRVLVYPYQDRNNYKVGDAVCAAPNGTADIMTREEIIQYPDRIIGIVDEIPKYKIWQSAYTNTKNCDGTGEVGETNTTDIQVNGRIWIYVR